MATHLRDLMFGRKVERNTFLKSCKVFLSIISVIILGILVTAQFQAFANEPTGSSLKSKSVDPLPFPALSICDPNYEYRKAIEDLNVPLLPFERPKEVMSTTSILYYQMDRYGMNISQNLWKYYFTLDKIFDENRRFSCLVGKKSCLIREKAQDIVYPSEGNAAIEFQVEAGKWTSRMIADSYNGLTYMCHTLVPNMSVDHSIREGNTIGLGWNLDYAAKSTFWHVFIHDPYEKVTLPTHVISRLAGLTFFKSETKQEIVANRKKARIDPRLFQFPSPSKSIPCETDPDYSQNWCLLRWGWRKKFDELRQLLGENFTCQIPGIYIDEKYRLPECQHGRRSGVGHKGLGLVELTSQLLYRELKTSLAFPPVGIYDKSADCPNRCSYYTYELEEEKVTDIDDLLQVFEVVLYFASSSVEVWTDYRLRSLFDFLAEVGGSIGLILGMSLLSLAFLLLDFMYKLISPLVRSLFGRRSQRRIKKTKRYLDELA